MYLVGSGGCSGVGTVMVSVQGVCVILLKGLSYNSELDRLKRQDHKLEEIAVRADTGVIHQTAASNLLNCWLMVTLAAADTTLGTAPTQDFVRTRIQPVTAVPVDFSRSDAFPTAQDKAVDVATADVVIFPDTFPAAQVNALLDTDAVEYLDEADPELDSELAVLAPRIRTRT